MAEDLTIGNGLDEGPDFVSDPSKLPTSNELPLGTVELRIVGGKGKYTPEATEPGKVGGYAIVSVQFVMTDNPGQAAFTGMPCTHDFFIGSKEDPKARKPATWTRNATLLMSLFKEGGVSVAGGAKLPELLAAAQDQIVLADVRRRGGNKPAFADQHVIKKFYRAGTKPVQLLEMEADARAAADPELAAAFTGVSNHD